jgi:hypothetical protein
MSDVLWCRRCKNCDIIDMSSIEWILSPGYDFATMSGAFIGFENAVRLVCDNVGLRPSGVYSGVRSDWERQTQ